MDYNSWFGFNENLERKWKNELSSKFLKQFEEKDILQVRAEPRDFVLNNYSGTPLGFQKAYVQRLFLKYNAKKGVWYAFDIVQQPRYLKTVLENLSLEWQWFCRNTGKTVTNFEYIAVQPKSKIVIYRKGAEEKNKVLVLYKNSNIITTLQTNVLNIPLTLFSIPFRNC